MKYNGGNPAGSCTKCSTNCNVCTTNAADNAEICSNCDSDGFVLIGTECVGEFNFSLVFNAHFVVIVTEIRVLNLTHTIAKAISTQMNTSTLITVYELLQYNYLKTTVIKI